MLKQQPIRPVCYQCNTLPVRPNGKTALGFTRWHTRCNRCIKVGRKKQKDPCCTACGFVATDSCQLCLVDGVTLCQNCNALRLKAKRQRKELTVDATVNWGNIRL